MIDTGYIIIEFKALLWQHQISQEEALSRNALEYPRQYPPQPQRWSKKCPEWSDYCKGK